MKAFVVFAAVCFVAVSAIDNHLDPTGNNLHHQDVVGSKLKAVYEECMFENGLTQESLQEMAKTRNLKPLGCVAACMHEKLGLIDENGEINVDAYIKLANDALQLLRQKVTIDLKPIVLDCKDIIADISDRCDKYMTMSKCVAQSYMEQYRLNQKQ